MLADEDEQIGSSTHRPSAGKEGSRRAIDSGLFALVEPGRVGLLWYSALVGAVDAVVGTVYLGTLAGRWRGGTIIPMFLVGYCLGRAILSECGYGAGAVTFVLAMMVACNTGMTKTPLGSTLVTAQTAGIAQFPAMTVAALTSLALTTRVTFVTNQRTRFPPPATTVSTAVSLGQKGAGPGAR